MPNFIEIFEKFPENSETEKIIHDDSIHIFKSLLIRAPELHEQHLGARRAPGAPWAAPSTRRPCVGALALSAVLTKN